jgi:glycosyltransferase involved in cell wall biosynthesis
VLDENLMKNSKILTLVLPVYKEGEAVIPVISTLFLTIRYPFKIVVVYDSPDDTTIISVEKLKKYFEDIHLVQNKWKRGVLNALKTGFDHADTPYVGIWVAYHVDPFGILNDMMERLEQGFDLVSANRFTVESGRARGDKIKKLLSYAGNMILNNIIGMPISDVTTSLKIYRKSLIDEFKIETLVNSGWAMSMEISIKAAIKGYRLAEVPLERKNINLIHGITNFRVFKQLPDYFHWLFYGWKNRKLIRSNIKSANKEA